MKRALPWIAAAMQFALLAYMAGEREWVARTGQIVLLRTASIDPRDPMRGDYVRLDYEIAHVPRELCRDGVAAWFDDDTIYSRENRDRRVYAALRLDEAGIADIVSLSDRPPADGLFLRGRVDSLHRAEIEVRYGVEAFFMEQGQALAFEQAARGEKMGVPVNARVAVSGGGLGVLRNYVWEPLGLQIEVRRTAPPADAAEEIRRAFEPAVVGAELTLKNHGEAPLAIVDLPQGRSFRLQRVNRWQPGSHAPVESTSPPPAPTPASVIVLAPGESHRVALDFSRPEWFVVPDTGFESSPEAAPVAIPTLSNQWSAWFRVEYTPPSREVCAGLPDADLIWHRRLRSRAFSAGGAVD